MVCACMILFMTIDDRRVSRSNVLNTRITEIAVTDTIMLHYTQDIHYCAVRKRDIVVNIVVCAPSCCIELLPLKARVVVACVCT